MRDKKAYMSFNWGTKSCICHHWSSMRLCQLVGTSEILFLSSTGPRYGRDRACLHEGRMMLQFFMIRHQRVLGTGSPTDQRDDPFQMARLGHFPRAIVTSKMVSNKAQTEAAISGIFILRRNMETKLDERYRPLICGDMIEEGSNARGFGQAESEGP